jgi:outer membrane protein W
LKRIGRLIPLLLILLLAGTTFVHAQSGFSPYFGLGSATNSPATDTADGCPSKNILDGITGFCEPAPSMGGVFGVFGADFMLKTHLGINGEYAFHFTQAPYLPLGSIKDRPTFYDFNAIYQPFSASKRFVPILEGGLGGAKLSLYFSQQSCATSTVCSTQSQLLASSNHFQLHGAAGVKIYLKPSVFIKPQFDLHWVHNLTEFGRTIVPQYTVSVGFTFGSH